MYGKTFIFQLFYLNLYFLSLLWGIFCLVRRDFFVQGLGIEVMIVQGYEEVYTST